MKNVEKKRPPKITMNQLAVFDYIKWFIVERGRTPERKEITAHFGWQSSSTTTEYIARLTDHGFLIDTAEGIKILKWAGVSEPVEYQAQEKRGPKKAILWDTETPEVRQKTKWLTMPWRESA